MQSKEKYYIFVQMYVDMLGLVMKERRKVKRLIVDVDDYTHRKMKMVSALRNISIREYILRLVIKSLDMDLKLQGLDENEKD